MPLTPESAQKLKSNETLHRVRIEHDKVDQHTEIEELTLDCSHLDDVWLRHATIKKSELTHSTLKHVNLRNSTLVEVDFTGTRFIECNLAYATFDRCKLWYVSFDRCKINYDSILKTLPGMTNLRFQVLRSLRQNAASEGDDVRAKSLLLLELKAQRYEFWNRFSHSAAYYEQRYNGWKRWVEFFRWSCHACENIFWGYGLSIRTLALNVVIVILALASITWYFEVTFAVALDNGTLRPLSFPESLYFTIIAMTTVGFGDIAPASDGARGLGTLMALVGITIWGFFVAAVYRRLAR